MHFRERYAFNWIMDTQDETPLDIVKRRLGGNTGIARALGNISPQAVSQWMEVPIKRAIELEEKTGISRHVSRPDIFGSEKSDGRAA